MKIIGKTSGDSYICTVDHCELEGRLAAGAEIDLGRGYDFASQIADCMRKTQAFVQANQQVVTAILDGLNFQRISEKRASRPPLRNHDFRIALTHCDQQMPDGVADLYASGSTRGHVHDHLTNEIMKESPVNTTHVTNPCHTDELIVKPFAIAGSAVLSGLRCDGESSESREECFVPCRAPAVALIHHTKGSRRTTLACLACARLHIRRHGARLLLTTDPALVR